MELKTTIGRPYTTIQCDECLKFLDKVIEFDTVDSYDKSFFYLCKNCLKKALLLIEGD